MIDLNKKYKTNHGWDVVLLDIVENKVFGRYYNPALQQWYSTEWKISTGKCQFVSAIGDNYNLVEVPEFKVNSVKYKKLITYFGVELQVPNWTKWVATDADGELVAFANKPLYTFNHWYSEIDKVLTLKESVNYDGDWRKSLREVK